MTMITKQTRHQMGSSLVVRMTMMLMALLSVSQCLAWTTVPLASIRQQQRLRMPLSVLRMSDQWDDEPELPAAPTEPVPEKIASGPWKVEGTLDPDELEELFRKNDLTTYDEANSAMVDEKEQEELEAMGGADNYIPGSEPDNQDKLRDLVKARTESLGIEESQVSKDAIAAAAARAANRAGSGPMGDMVDLSQVTYDSPLAPKKKNLLSIEYNPEDELSEDQMSKADPLSAEPIWTQMLEELKTIVFPDFATAFGKVVLLIVLGAGSALLILNADSLIRQLYESNGILPTIADIEAAKENNLRLAEELSKSTTTAVPPVSSAVEGMNLPDLGM